MRLIPGDAPRHLFFTGKGGVGKTSLATATAVELADAGRRVLLVSTDPASNLDEVLGVALGSEPRDVPGVPGLRAMNIDPEAAARAYREKLVGPMRGKLPAASIRSMEEQLSGACTVEIAAFDEFSKLLGDPAATRDFDHVVFDTAPTGHTLRLMQLPKAWSGFLDASSGSASCLGPLAGLEAQRSLYAATRDALADSARTAVVLVARPDRSSLAEAERTRGELAALGVTELRLVVNGVFVPAAAGDPLADALARRGADAIASMPAGLAGLERSDVALRRAAVVGVESVRDFLAGRDAAGDVRSTPEPDVSGFGTIDALLDAIDAGGHGAVLTVGKGGVGKTSVARAIATALARRGRRVHLTTTDPAGERGAGETRTPLAGEAPSASPGDATPGPATSGDGSVPSLTGGALRVSRIDADAETRAYAAEVIEAAGGDSLDEDTRALLEEDLRSPCTQEIAIFRAFARVVADGADGFVVIDTAPSGHTLLLLDAAESYHREVARTQGPLPEAVRTLLPRLRDPAFTRVVVVALPEATPVHEAAALQRELRRAGIEPFAWVVNQSLAPHAPTDRVLAARRRAESRWLDEVVTLAPPGRAFVVPFGDAPPGDAPPPPPGDAPKF